MLFSCVSNGIKHRIIDVSYQAFQSSYFPVSLGLRSQTLKLRFLSPDSKGYFLKPDISFEEITRSIKERFNASLPKPIFHQDFIGETLSQIYAPFYVDGKLYDAVLNKAVSLQPQDDFNPFALPGGAAEWRVRFIPAQCPRCGWDLKGQRDSLALICDQCHSVWYPGKEKLKEIPFVFILEKSNQVTYLPFYRMQADVSGIPLGSYADLIKVANLPKVVRDDWKEIPFYFWSPAFKVRPDDFLHFSCNLTLFQPQGKWISEFPKAQHYPVTLPLTEAIDSLKLGLASFMKPQRSLFPKLEEIEIRPKGFLLVFIPFHERGNELFQLDYRLRINKNLLKYARYL